jgi:hypothetical protein
MTSTLGAHRVGLPGVPVVAVQAEPTARLLVNASELTARGDQIVTVTGGDSIALPAVEPPWGPLE